MSRRTSSWLVPVVLLLTPPACAKLPPPPGTPGAEGELPLERLPSMEAVPAAWGKLVSVNLDTGIRDAYLLWFQNDSGEIHLVGLNASTNRLWEAAAVIRRN